MVRRRVVPRCPKCFLHVPICLCAAVRPQAIATRVVVVMHHYEGNKKSNTGRLLTLALDQAEVRLRGRPHTPLDTEGLLNPARRVVLLYPTPEAEPIDAAWRAADPRPVTLVVPDGNWKQASKVVKREPAFAALPRVTLPPGPPSRYRLRRHPDPDRICTLEAVARALGVLEGPAVRAELERLLDVFVERTLWSRGNLPEAEVTGGIPDKHW